ncbi:lytic transglycosylase domain-containing protein [Sphingomonas crusticola]|uniref:lytic transglycosylase domain-containing protein n=1 Tax=Sphingomonas crusticola TaxID=1697973 RepID=UPI000E2204EA|nr:lytic transglycosylase domain-containing protein [Sphingomonas crusticola]
MKPIGNRKRRASDSDAPARLSSIARFGPAALLLVSVAAGAAVLTIQTEQPAGIQSDRAASADANWRPARTDALWPVIDEWTRLRQSDRLPFADYARFLIAHRAWPGEPAMRRAAERQIAPDQSDAALVVQYFTLYPPLTGAGRVRYAEALAATGQTAKARDAAAAAWTMSAVSADDEARLIARFGGQFTPSEQDQRMEVLLWDRASGSARRQLALVSAQRRPIYAARLAYQTQAPDADAQGVALGPDAEHDAGYIIDRALWLRNSAREIDARTYLARAETLAAPAFDPQAYLATLLTFASAAAHDKQWSLAYGIAANLDHAFPNGADIRARDLTERDPYTSLAWLAGTAALKQLNRPRDAEAMFARYRQASQTPGSQAKGDYWAGRAAQAAGDVPAANLHFAAAAANVDQYYGQLATERLGRTIAVPADPPPLAIAPEVRTAFANREVVRAVRLLGEQRDWQTQTAFVRKIAADAETDSDHALAAELARSIQRPDLGVIVSRNARKSGARDPIRIGFPTVPVPPTMESHWTMIHAIARQESQFDREALSPAGARGLTQLMPATAREQAGKLGLPWDPSRLTKDIGYNVMIGSSFFDRMLTYYSGSYVLAVASYNAGPGNVNKFIRANGDPRQPGVDVVDWVEAIPLTETRSYVQKVLENAVVYDLFNPARARTPEKDRLSYYLGKKSAG